MASPDGLRLYFGKHAPSDVLDLIFQYGFHLWLAKPVDMLSITDHAVDWATGQVHYGRFAYCSPYPGIYSQPKLGLVLEDSLSQDARRLVDYDKYIRKMHTSLFDEEYRRYARPTAFEYHFKALFGRDRWNSYVEDLGTDNLQRAPNRGSGND